jgi:hypothetical protein
MARGFAAWARISPIIFLARLRHWRTLCDKLGVFGLDSGRLRAWVGGRSSHAPPGFVVVSQFEIYLSLDASQ